MEILKPKYRYPLFFAGFAIMALSGFAYKYMLIDKTGVVIGVAIGFVLFVLSIALP